MPEAANWIGVAMAALAMADGVARRWNDRKAARDKAETDRKAAADKLRFDAKLVALQTQNAVQAKQIKAATDAAEAAHRDLAECKEQHEESARDREVLRAEIAASKADNDSLRKQVAALEAKFVTSLTAVVADGVSVNGTAGGVRR